MQRAHDELFPTEALVLLNPNDASGRGAVRASLLHLASAGYLRTETQAKRSWLDAGGIRLCRTELAGRPPEPLAAVLDALFPPGKPATPLAPAEVTHRLQSAFRYDYARYLAQHIRPRLVAGGLLDEEEYRWMGLVPRRRFRLTPAGERRRGRIDARLQGAGEIPGLLQRDPRRAAAAAVRLGGLVLVAEGLRPHLGALAQAARSEPDTALLAALDKDEDERRIDWLDAADLLTGVDWGAIIDIVDGVADAFDAGGDAGGADGGDGGGDGGGGE